MVKNLPTVWETQVWSLGQEDTHTHIYIYIYIYIYTHGFPGHSVGKNPHASVGDPGLIPASGRSPRGGNGYPLQNSCLENPNG